MENTTPKKGITFIGILLMAYFSLIACENSRLNIYGGFILLVGSIIIENIFSKNRMRIIFPTSCKWFYYFVVFCFFSRIWAWEVYYVTNLSKQLIAVLLLITIPTGYFIKKRNPSVVIAAVACVGIVLSVYVVIEEGGFSAFYNNATRTGARIGSEITNVNRIGMASAFSSIVLGYYGIFKKKRWCLLPAILTLMVSAASGSRKTIILLAIGIILIIMLSQKDRNGAVRFFKVLVGLFVGFVVLRFIMSLDIMSTIRLRMDGLIATLTGDGLNADASANSRKAMIEIGWQQFLETPFFGIGLGNSRVLYWQRRGYYMYLHNDYIEQLVNGGIVGFLLYYGNVFYIVIRHIKLMKIRKDPELIISFTILIMFLVMNVACVTYYDFLQTALYFILWITTIEVKKVEFAQMEEDAQLTDKSEKGELVE